MGVDFEVREDGFEAHLTEKKFNEEGRDREPGGESDFFSKGLFESEVRKRVGGRDVDWAVDFGVKDGEVDGVDGVIDRDPAHVLEA